MPTRLQSIEAALDDYFIHETGLKAVIAVAVPFAEALGNRRRHEFLEVPADLAPALKAWAAMAHKPELIRLRFDQLGYGERQLEQYVRDCDEFRRCADRLSLRAFGTVIYEFHLSRAAVDQSAAILSSAFDLWVAQEGGQRYAYKEKRRQKRTETAARD